MDFLESLERLKLRQREISDIQRWLGVFGLCVLAILILYVLPTFFEAITQPYLGIWLSCSVFGDLTGCICLWFLGWKRQALSVYLWSKVGEVLLFEVHLLSADSLLWVTDLLPVIICADLLVSKIFFVRDDYPELRA
jgi:hypothetical protein